MTGSKSAQLTISAFQAAPEFAIGLIRDIRVRWACEEIGLKYETTLLDGSTPRPGDYLRAQPFGQVPALWEGNIAMFESGAILLYIAEKDERLMPRDEPSRARTLSWVFAALNTIEPPLTFISVLDFFVAHEDWAKPARPTMLAFARLRLQQLSEHLGVNEWLEGRFTVADLLMICVLRSVRHTELISEFPNLADFQARGEARPAFVRALQAQAYETIAMPAA